LREVENTKQNMTMLKVQRTVTEVMKGSSSRA